jgi:hypothetical protein
MPAVIHLANSSSLHLLITCFRHLKSPLASWGLGNIERYVKKMMIIFQTRCSTVFTMPCDISRLALDKLKERDKV